MTRKNTKTQMLKTAGAFACATAAILPMASAHAGYDVASGRASGSYDSNSRGTMRSRTTYSRSTSNATSGRAVNGSFARTTVITTRTTSDMLMAGSNVTVTGTLIEDADDKNFAIRDAWGQTWNITTSRVVNAEATNKFQKGQVVRVYGTWNDNKLDATNVRDLGTGVAFGTRVQYQSRYYVIGQNTTIAGVLVTDADDDEFQIRDSNGVTTMIRTRLIPDAMGANKLQKGQMVRVSGYWIAAADGVQPQLEATNFRAM